MVNMADDLVFVTGGSGYLGSKVVENLLLNRVKFQSLDRGICDLAKYDDVARVLPFGSKVIHCAANVPKILQDYSDELDADQNLIMVANILARKPKRIIFISSMSVYEEIFDVVKESEVLLPNQPYAKSKFKSELLIKNSGVPNTILRLPGLFGPPRRSGLLYNVAHSFLNNQPPCVMPSKSIWAGLYVDDAADLVVKAFLDKPLGTVNVGTEDIFSVGRAVNLLGELIGISEFKINEPDIEFSMDLSKLKNTLGLPKYTFYERLCDLVKWIKSA